MRPAVQADLLADVRKPVEHEASRRNELIVLVRLIDASHLLGSHQRPLSFTRTPQRSQR
jgi:hypothetical protein